MQVQFNPRHTVNRRRQGHSPFAVTGPQRRTRRCLATAAGCLALALSVAGCKRGESPGGAGRTESAASSDGPGGIISIDGSSTVYPITEAVAEAFRQTSPAKVTIGVSGTGGGFKKFCKGETSITGASRPIKPVEVKQCRASGIDYIELPIAYDGIAVVVNPANDWAAHMTVSELAALWRPEAQGQVTRWSQVRTGWPDEEIHLFGAGVDSGTYDDFTHAIVGTEHSSRGDFTSSEDDNVLVQGVSRDRLALGFFGYAYYAENQKRLKLVAIDDGNPNNGQGPIAASPATVADGTYSPLSRPIFVYVSKPALAREDVARFVEFYIDQAPKLVPEVGYIALPQRAYALVEKRYSERVVGSLFEGTGSRVGVTVEALLAGR